MSIEEEISKANSFGNQIERLVVTKNEFPGSSRNMLLLGYWSLAFDHHRGILCLLSHKFNASASALMRPLIEATIRAHVTIMGSDEDIEKLKAEKYRTNFSIVGSEIDTYFGTQNFFANFLSAAKEALHSYTHAGIMQVSRRFSGPVVEDSHTEGEIIQAVHSSASAVFIVNNLVTRHFGLQKEWAENNRLFLEWGQHEPQPGTPEA